MRTCIYGAGAMGTVLGAFMSRAGMQVDLVTRNREHVAALNGGGANILLPAVGESFIQKVTALTPEEMSGKYDVVFLMTKQRDNAQTVKFILDYLAEDGVICTLQNGLPEYSVAAVAGEERTLGCAVSWGATYVCPGRVALTSSPDAMSFSLGSPFGANDKTSLVADCLACAGRVEIIADFAGARWSKLIVNSAFSTLSAVTSLTFGQIAGGFKSRALVQKMLKEGINTALALRVVPQKIQGHDLVKWLNYKGPVKRALSFAVLPFAMKKHKNLVSGMYYDLVSGKKCDVDFVAGAVERSAAKVGVKVPAISAAIALAHAIERGEESITSANILKLTQIIKNN